MSSHPFLFDVLCARTGGQNTTYIPTARQGTEERRSRDADRPEGATNASKKTYHQKEPQTANA